MEPFSSEERGSDQATSDPAAKKEEPSSLARIWSKIRWRAHCLLPNLIHHPYSHDEGFNLSRDQEQNEESRIGLDLELRCAMVWGVELYGPDEIHSLYAGLDKLGWFGIASSDPNNAAATRVRQMRRNGAGNWINIGRVLHRGASNRSLLISNFAPLPSGVESLEVGVFQITSSTTALLIGFRLDQSFARRYEQEINTDRKTTRRRAPGTWTMQWLEVAHQKEEALLQTRGDYRTMVGSWFARHVPGYFCATNPARIFPTMELLLARGLTLSDPVAVSSWQSWHSLLTRAVPREIWTTKDYPGLQLAFERHHDENLGLHILVSLDPDLFPEDATRHVGTSKVDAHTWLCNELLGGTLVYSATIEYLQSQIQNLHLMRERMKRARLARRHVSTTLNEIGSFFDQTLGSPAITRELAKHSKDAAWYRYRCAELTTPHWREADKLTALPEAIRSRVRNLSIQLSEEEIALRGQFEQLASILSVRESVRTQRWMFVLTIIALLVAIASLIVAIPAESAFGRVVQSAIHRVPLI